MSQHTDIVERQALTIEKEIQIRQSGRQEILESCGNRLELKV